MKNQNKKYKQTDFKINENALNRISQSATQIYSTYTGIILANLETLYYDENSEKFRSDNTNNLDETLKSLIQYSANKALELETAIQSKITFDEIGVDENMLRRFTVDGKTKKYDLPNQLIERIRDK